MNTVLPIHQERVLLYNLDAHAGKGMQVRQVLESLGVDVVDIPVESLDQTVGAVAGIPGYGRMGSPYTGPAPIDDVLIMMGFSDERINQLLGQLRQAAVPRIGLMATVTEHNRSWTLLQLIDELASERRIMGAYMNLQQTVKAVLAQYGAHADEGAGDASGSGSPISALNGPEADKFDCALAAATAILNNEEPAVLEDIGQADETLRRFLA